jgi:triosephosphate isomerase
MENRIPLIAGNWKMYKTCSEANNTADELVSLVKDVTDVEVMIAPAFTALASVADVIAKSNIALGAQDMFWENEGAYTGEISPSMLISAGCSYVIIGHSERRQFFKETDETVNKKIKAAIKNKLSPVLCIGESDKERESNKTFSVLDKQLTKGLEGLSGNDLEKLVVAYEPIWAIGTGKTASDKQAQEVHGFLRSMLEKHFGDNFSQSVRVLYGGSVKPENISSLMSMPDIDGALVGGASLRADTFSKIIHFNT